MVGDITGNLELIRECIEAARKRGGDVLICPELALTGYPPEDLLLRPGFMARTESALEELCSAVQGIDVIVGHPRQTDAGRFNAASWIRDGAVIATCHKRSLPNYAVFDERRYFSSGEGWMMAELGGQQIGVMICEDTWQPDAAARLSQAGAGLLVSINASPYRQGKQEARENTLRERHAETGLPIIYLNCVGGQDDLVFDGRSVLVSRDGGVSEPAAHCQDFLLSCTYTPENGALTPHDWPRSGDDATGRVYEVLVRGLHDYVVKNGFSDVVLGLSGGIDSALTAAIAVDALGPDQVHAVMLPSRHTSQLSLDLAAEQADMLGLDYRTIEIEAVTRAQSQVLAESFVGELEDITEENLQARARAVLLMALSNKFNWMLLATGNKSEMAVGYSTIYGDMAGGFAPLKDCYKTLVYELAAFRNLESPAVPQGVIERAPTAELAADQFDQQSLPPYDQLDAILHRYVDLDQSIADIVADGHEESTVRRVAGMVLRNEYKRRQSAPGVRVTEKIFGRDRRYPITSGWRDSG